ncbi:MAG: hypothetical protein N2316_03065, partial [Spirochaetes bacterium]|nr:hypothetical protein [Spirochaetota bacterium]
AFSIAQRFFKSPDEIGKAIDFLAIKITKCQLGLFGYGKVKKIIKPAEHVPTHLYELLIEVAHDNRISCKALWDVANRAGIAKFEAACACEKLGIKITECQLGAF